MVLQATIQYSDGSELREQTPWVRNRASADVDERNGRWNTRVQSPGSHPWRSAMSSARKTELAYTTSSSLYGHLLAQEFVISVRRTTIGRNTAAETAIYLTVDNVKLEGRLACDHSSCSPHIEVKDIYQRSENGDTMISNLKFGKLVSAFSSRQKTVHPCLLPLPRGLCLTIARSERISTW